MLRTLPSNIHLFILSHSYNIYPVFIITLSHRKETIVGIFCQTSMEEDFCTINLPIEVVNE